MVVKSAATFNQSNAHSSLLKDSVNPLYQQNTDFNSLRKLQGLTRPICLVFVAWLVSHLFIGCGRPAQMGPSDEVLSAVDALYTAISSRRIELLNASSKRIDELRAKGDLPEAAHRQLNTYVEESRAGHWDSAVRKLHEFIRGQRRKS